MTLPVSCMPPRQIERNMGSFGFGKSFIFSDCIIDWNIPDISGQNKVSLLERTGGLISGGEVLIQSCIP